MARVVLVAVSDWRFGTNTAVVRDARTRTEVGYPVPAGGLTLVGTRVYLPGTWLGFEDGLHRVSIPGGPAVWVKTLVEDVPRVKAA